ncbi:cytochrome bd ubiquinol oxidase subunit II [Pseudohongiella nitratireducens]|uniref:Cytochrome bd ubiquinol oxidase subunit II n=1 Tax=Pseudohongiella nitratireducens TaxID=1768907 RepID=A0A917LU90_9GAMM|nr:cytochrome d ubiquinol oxidase subunit II [Pseudohongiella nitratireducens]MDF1623657.1 cytochrome d ubiquinol oxidase subunit II [Pseudohongiella nitratireducens]GGG58172.1 cytochrome bd ubiquinol oxidase subunit II [Pseudohongiella nitratireducens]|tara:strand:+ start:16816 stop:17808 length:993 start_codon:yes stop_codon:yes gene_type:complete
MEFWLPVIYMATMGLALLIYVILDGYDLGVGMLLPWAEEDEKDTMIASIGPFWDANETWIVLGVGILLIAFPMAHGIVLTHLYIPVTLMLIGLTLRGVAFDLRVKAGDHRKGLWNRAFFAGSSLASLSQGWMLGAYVTGLQSNLTSYLFAGLIALTLPALYFVLGAAWLLMKTEADLQQKAIKWARVAILPMGVGLLLISIATPLVSQTIADKWFTWPNLLMMSPIPIFTAACFGIMLWLLKNPARVEQGQGWILYAATVAVCLLVSLGLGYSLYPDIIIGQMTIWEASASVKSLLFTLFGVALTLPAIIVYTIVIYRIFHGKAADLSYD